MTLSANPSLYQINTRVILGEISQSLDRRASLDDIPDEYLDRIARFGFDWVWLLGIWQTGMVAREISRTRKEWQAEIHECLPDVTDDDVSGSPFAVQDYSVHEEFGGDEALARIRERLKERGFKLLLDFVPNHTAPDHHWVREHPEYYIQGDGGDLEREPNNYCEVETEAGKLVLAHGRDPYFPGWADTLQLNYRHPGFRQAIHDELSRIAARCDGVRCDMAMLVLPDIFQQTWGDASHPPDTEPDDTPFWPDAIEQIRGEHPDFVFMAEVYWDLETVLQEQGFDYTYDKKLYDHLTAQDASKAKSILFGDSSYLRRSSHFLENHDEPRASSTFPPEVHQAAAVVSFLIPGLRFFHEGQIKGRKVKVSMHVGRRQSEPTDPGVMDFYIRLLECLSRDEANNGEWQVLECHQAWDDNDTWDQFIAFSWLGENRQRMLVTVNYGSIPGQCYVKLPLGDLEGRRFLLRDLMSESWFEREGDEMRAGGLYLELPPWGYHVFELEPSD